MLTKHFNLVRAVKYYLLFCGMDVDEKSFANVDEKSFADVEVALGPFDIPEGIMLTSLQGARRCCEQFDFIIDMQGGIIRCMTREQWIEYAGN